MNHRQLLRSVSTLAIGTACELLQPVKSVAADVKRVRIQNIEAFGVQIPGGQTPAPAASGFIADPRLLTCTRVTTGAGIRGYSFLGGPSVSPKKQAQQATIVKNAGFKAMKIRIFRPNYMDDVEACSEILAAGGPGFRTMVDRTATLSGLWTYQQGLAAEQALEKAGVFWLEEPFDRNDFEGPARLRREVGIIITGGEGYRGLAADRECLTHSTYGILQPDCNTVGGILILRKVGALCQAWGIPVCPHALSGLALAGRVQASAALGSMYQEIGVLTPPQLPNDRITPVMPI